MLTDPLAFGDAGRRYALATAGAALDLGEESLSDQDGEVEEEEEEEAEEAEESSAEESAHSSGASEGVEVIPQEIAQSSEKQAREAERQRGKRATRRREIGREPSGMRSRQARKGVGKERYKQTENYRGRKREQKDMAKERRRDASPQPATGGLELPVE